MKNETKHNPLTTDNTQVTKEQANYPTQDERYYHELKENEADAKLIAAAPEMLKALISITKGEGRYNPDRMQHAENCIQDMMQTAREAVEKALNINQKTNENL